MLSYRFQGLWLICETVKMTLSSNQQETRNEGQSESTFIKPLYMLSFNLHGTRGPRADMCHKLPTQVRPPFLFPSRTRTSNLLTATAS